MPRPGGILAVCLASAFDVEVEAAFPLDQLSLERSGQHGRTGVVNAVGSVQLEAHEPAAPVPLQAEVPDRSGGRLVLRPRATGLVEVQAGELILEVDQAVPRVAQLEGAADHLEVRAGRRGLDVQPHYVAHGQAGRWFQWPRPRRSRSFCVPRLGGDGWLVHGTL